MGRLQRLPVAALMSLLSMAFLRTQVSTLGIRPQTCRNVLGHIGTCMFVWECIKTEGKHLGTCVDGFLFGSCCAHNESTNIVAGASTSNVFDRWSTARPTTTTLTTSKTTATFTKTSKVPYWHTPATSLLSRTPISSYIPPTSTRKSSSYVYPTQSSSLSTSTPSTTTRRPFVSSLITRGPVSSSYPSWTFSGYRPTSGSTRPTTRRPTVRPTERPYFPPRPSWEPHKTSYYGFASRWTTRPTRPSTSTSKPSTSTSKPSTSTSKPLTSASKPSTTEKTSAASSTITRPQQFSRPPMTSTTISTNILEALASYSTGGKPTTQTTVAITQRTYSPTFVFTLSSNGTLETLKPTTRPSTTVSSLTRPSTTVRPLTTLRPSTTAMPSTTVRPSTRPSTTVRPSTRPSTTVRPSTRPSTTVRNTWRPIIVTASRPIWPITKEQVSTSTMYPAITTLPPSIKPDLTPCGIQNPHPQKKVVGGKNSAFGSWPWQASVRRTSFFGFSSTHRCGGALISRQWIATAGHCVDDLLLSQIKIRVGEYDFASVQEPHGYLERGVKRKVVHPRYNFFTYENDLALVQLEEVIDAVKYPHIAPICLPPSEEDLVGKNATVTGWGRLSEGGVLPSILQEVQVPIISNEKCKNMFLAAGRHEYIPEIFMCAGFEEGGRDSCQGDSGGPLQIQGDDGHWFLAGIISWGIGCAEPNMPGVCTRISKFKDWVLQNIT